MHQILSSNKRDKASADRKVESEAEIHLKRMLDFVWIRIQERFKNLSPAFRFFDTNFNNRVSFNEFTRGMEALKVKMSSKDQLLVFNHLDVGEKGYVNYQDFCNLSEERRLNIDPASHMLEEYRNKGHLSYNFGAKQAKSPSRREKDRVRMNNSELTKMSGNN